MSRFLEEVFNEQDQKEIFYKIFKGLITDVISKHRVMVKFKNRGKNKEDIYHPKTLGLIFCPATPTHFMAITSQDQTELNPLLSSFWDKLASSLKHANTEPSTTSSTSR